MTDKAPSTPKNPTATIRHVAMVTGVVFLLVSFGQPWATITLTTGQVLSRAGSDQSPLALSLILTAAAAYALSLLLHGVGFRVATAVQTGASLGALAAAITALADPVGPAAAEITLLTGLSGDETVASLVTTVTVSSVVVGFGVAGMALCTISGALGAVWGRTIAPSESRFERPGSPTPRNPWDQLSDGVDPTDL